jgi:penicillin-binding protein 1A
MKREPSALRQMFSLVWRWTKRIAMATASLALLGALALWWYARDLEAELPPVGDLQNNYKPPQVTRILARDGSVIAELFTERRTVVAIETLPDHVKKAVLAAEDASFYEHEGINYFGIARAAYVNLRSGEVKQGGSTITQQVVKNVLLDSERSYRRKMKEALLARKLEHELKKDEILELYLNHIYFGHGRYGIEEAARDLFGKSAKDLSVSEAALIAGIIACPESCAPRRDLRRALERRGRTLARMAEKGFIAQTVYVSVKDDPVRLVPALETRGELAPEVVALVRRTLHELAPERSALGGFTVTTTIDPRMQAAARKAVRENLMAYDKRHGLQGALRAALVTDPKKGKKAPSRTPAKDSAFEGTPSFESHKVYVGTVEETDDTTGTVTVRVGTALGTFKLADYDRYNPAKLAPSAYAQVGARVRVSLLAPVAQASAQPNAQPNGQVAPASVPLRLESGPQAAFVALDVKTREVLALVGNYEAAAGGLDRATQARRQPGSTFKPIVYSYALHSRRFTPASLIDVTPATFGDYKPSNYEGWTAKDPLRLREVLAQSVNIGAVRVLQDVGPENVVGWAKALGIHSKLEANLSLALGSYEVEPLELCAAYATFAGGGLYDAPKIITRITGPDGKDLALKEQPPARRVLDEAEAYVTTHMLTSVVDHGTATRAKVLGRPVAGKTGTTNGSKDTWFAGYSPDIAAVSWVGYDDGKPLGPSEAGGLTALPAWVAFMKVAHEGRPAVEFPRPAGVVTMKIDAKTGKLPYPDDTDVMEEVFLEHTEPVEVAELPAPDAGGADAEPSSGAPADAGPPVYDASNAPFQDDRK